MDMNCSACPGQKSFVPFEFNLWCSSIGFSVPAYTNVRLLWISCHFHINILRWFDTFHCHKVVLTTFTPLTVVFSTTHNRICLVNCIFGLVGMWHVLSWNILKVLLTMFMIIVIISMKKLILTKYVQKQL